MRTTLAKYGLGFGHLGVKVRGTTKYHLSPMEQKAFAGAFSVGVPNTLWRIRRLVRFNYYIFENMTPSKQKFGFVTI